MGMQYPFGMRRAICRCLMESHGVWERSFKQIVIPGSNLVHGIRQITDLPSGKILQMGNRLTSNQHHLKMAEHCRERNQCNKMSLAATTDIPFFFF